MLAPLRLGWQSHDLPQGRLELDICRALLPPEALLTLGARQNPRRAFLFVSKVLAKHLPVRLPQLEEVFALLAAQLPQDLPEPLLFIGLAETATGLAQGVFEAHLKNQNTAEALYLHSSRLPVRGAERLSFEESHSHAPQQWLHLPREALRRQRFHRARSLILLDDELSTGHTFQALQRTLRPHLPDLRRVLALSLADFAPADIGLERYSLLRGSWEFHPREDTPPPTLAPATERPPEIEDSGCGRLGLGEALALRWPEQAFAGLRPGQRLRLIGTGEFIYPAIVLARFLEQKYGVESRIQSSTRSPALAWGALRQRLDFADPYDAGVPYYLYNLERTPGEALFIVHEHEANAALVATAAALEAVLIRPERAA